MSLDLLGDGFDLHGGGQDLAFPHHENERAQAVAVGQRFARHWVHNGFVEVGGEKMSKSLGNFTNLLDLVDEHDPRAYRLLVLRSHYRSPIEVTEDTVADAEAALDRLDAFARRLAAAAASRPSPTPTPLARFRDGDGRRPRHARGRLALLFDLVRGPTALDDGDAAAAAALAAAGGRDRGGGRPRAARRGGGRGPGRGARLGRRAGRRPGRKDWPRADALATAGCGRLGRRGHLGRRWCAQA